MNFLQPSIHEVKPGTVITFVYGPGESPEPEFATAKGVAYGLRKNARFGDSLRVKMPCGRFEYVTNFVTRGIGAYLPEQTEREFSLIAKAGVKTLQRWIKATSERAARVIFCEEVESDFRANMTSLECVEVRAPVTHPVWKRKGNA